MLEELEDGTSKPLKVQAEVRRPRPERRVFVLKRAGGAGGTTRTAHIVSEFTAMAMYARAGLRVPAAALYTVKASFAHCSTLQPAARAASDLLTAFQLACCSRVLTCNTPACFFGLL